ncbi:unnamed protein product [Zymoseptoria tritici ST99CH_3D1]|nr:unnamed protein product [Zymoseptoria tritici ST99CH_3D1]
MPKRKASAESPYTGHTAKRLSTSLSALAAKASSEALRYQPSGSFLNVFMPHSTRSSSRRTRSSLSSLQSKPTAPEPLKPGLSLSNRLLSTHPEHDIAGVKEILLFPKSLAVLKKSWICRFTVNTTPQLGPPLPAHIEEHLFRKYISPVPLARPENVPYIHLGSTALAFQLHFYLILPHATTCPPRPFGGAGHMPYKDLQLVYDACIRPALEHAYPKRQPWASWLEAKNESHLKPLKARRQLSSCEPLQERLHCEGLQLFWDKMCACDDEEVLPLLEGMSLVAFGDVGRHDWAPDWHPSWALFKQAWNEAVDERVLGEGTRITVDMQLTL